MKPSGHGLLLGLVTAVVLAAVVAGFLVLGTPGDARKETLDRKRVEDLSNLSSALSGATALPASIEEVRRRAYWKSFGKDPETGEPYGYRRIASDRFELCATFSTAVTESDLESYRKEWAHPAGPACFEFELRNGSVIGPMRP